jgi:uncharacterized membrane protein
MKEESERTLERYERAHDPARVLALSDGVFAIIITLLVLEMHVPDLSAGQSLSDALSEVRPSFVAFLISFVVAAISWAGHRELFIFVRRMDRSLIWLNILYLLPVCLLPFGASLLSRYDTETLALQAYGVVLIAITATRLAAWLYATNRPHLLYEPLDARSRRDGVMLVAGPALAYVLAVAAAEFSSLIPMLIYAGAPALYFLGVIFVRAAAPPSAAEHDLI